MKIRRLILYTNKLQETKNFYINALGLTPHEETDLMFSIRIGWSILQFKKSTIPYLYHYCFLIPSNTLSHALEWMNERVDVLEVGDGERVSHFDDWNADSFYFYDGSGNIVEYIVHHDLNNTIEHKFDASALLGISEIGIGTDDVEKTNSILEEKCQTQFWKGDLIRFGTNGSIEGKFLIANYNKKETWFPTQVKIGPMPFEVEIENKDLLYNLVYHNGEIRKI